MTGQEPPTTNGLEIRRRSLQALTLCALLQGIVPAGLAEQYGDFTFISDGTNATITGYTGDGGHVVIPSTIAGNSVTTIGGWAFAECYSLTGVTIPDSVTAIGDEAFYGCTSLASLNIGNSVATIGDHTFCDCDDLGGITIPDSVTAIGDGAFFNCDGLTSVTIPENVATIGDRAFGRCFGLTSILVSHANPSFSSLDGVLLDRAHNMLMQFPSGRAGSYTVPGNVTVVGDHAFAHCGGLSSVIISDSVTNIGDGAFVACNSLISVTIGKNVTSIGDYVLAYCAGLSLEPGVCRRKLRR